MLGTSRSQLSPRLGAAPEARQGHGDTTSWMGSGSPIWGPGCAAWAAQAGCLEELAPDGGELAGQAGRKASGPASAPGSGAAVAGGVHHNETLPPQGLRPGLPRGDRWLPSGPVLRVPSRTILRGWRWCGGRPPSLHCAPPHLLAASLGLTLLLVRSHQRAPAGRALHQPRLRDRR